MDKQAVMKRCKLILSLEARKDREAARALKLIQAGTHIGIAAPKHKESYVRQ